MQQHALYLYKKGYKDYHAIDTISNSTATISINMTYYNFLLFKDMIKGSILLEDGNKIYTYEPDSLFYVGMWPSNNQDKFFYAFNGFYFNTDTFQNSTNGEAEPLGTEFIQSYISPDFNKILVYHKGNTKLENQEDRQYVGCVENNKFEETIEYFSGYMN